MKSNLYFKIALLMAGMISIYLVTAHSLIVRTMNMDTPGQIDHMIVLGAKVNGDVMSLSLYYRVREALQYLQENENTKVIVAGGQGKGEWITEAEAMASYFIKNDISEDRIIKEERSTTTLENIAFSRELIGEDVKELVIVTNDYHLYRASVIAKRYDFEPYPLAAETPRVTKTKAWLREFLAILKTLLLDW